MDHYIHAGLTKSGSTSIHHFLESNTQALLANGLLYPIDTQTTPDKRDMRLVTLIEEGRTDELNQLVRASTEKAKAAGAKTVVWPRSITGLIGPEGGQVLVDVLRSQGEAGRVGVIIIFRNWYDRMISLLNQEEKTSPQMFGDSRLDRIAERASDPSGLVAGWEAVVGADNVDIRIFETAVKAGLEKDVLGAMGIGWDEAYKVTPPMNSSLDPITARVINLLRQEWDLPNIHRKCERHTKAYPMPVTRKRFLDRLKKTVEATDFSHPKLAPHRDILTRFKEPDLAAQPTLEDFLTDLIGSLEIIKSSVEARGGVKPRTGAAPKPGAPIKPGRKSRLAQAG